MKLMQTVKTDKINTGSVLLVDTQAGVCYKIVKAFKKPGVFISIIDENDDETEAVHYLDSALVLGKPAKFLGYPCVISQTTESIPTALSLTPITRIEYYAD